MNQDKHWDGSGGAAPLLLLATVLFAALLFAGSAMAQPLSVPLAECAETVAPGQLTEGQRAQGFTVRRGEQVEPFDVEILGIDRGALGPGKDLILVNTQGAVIDEGGGGISAGMSGSPVYTADGRLIGAIAYGFSTGPSPIGGVTPAPDMLQVFNEPVLQGSRAFAQLQDEPGLQGRRAFAEVQDEGTGSAVQAAGEDSARLDPGSRARIARALDRPLSSVAGEMDRLTIPVLVSGVSRPEQLDALRQDLATAGARVLVGYGTRASLPPGPPSARLAPGDALGAVLSFGDITIAATGTTTYVCNGKALAFGHPFEFTGPTLLGASRARVLGIVSDPTFGPFKLASLADPVGIVDLDRFSAIRVRFGVPIPTLPAIQDTTALDTGNRRLGARTDVVGPTGSRPGKFRFAFAAFQHSVANLDRTFDQLSGGSAAISFAISGVRINSG